jgi:ethanolamine utilization microcompartment shell protein EutS
VPRSAVGERILDRTSDIRISEAVHGPVVDVGDRAAVDAALDAVRRELGPVMETTFCEE